jgi:CBS domain containing-hemolysin-like protein
MTALLACSAFFSASEAALFSLRPADRRDLRDEAMGRVAASLLLDPDRLLSAILFWNLVLNLAYFAVVSIVCFKLQATAPTGTSWVFAAGALMAVISFGEMLPKTMGVLGAKKLSRSVGRSVQAAVAVLDPIMPALRLVTRVSQRLLWPGLPAEPYLELEDLEQAITVSREDQALADQERIVLKNIVSLSDIRIDEWMRPRTQFTSFRPPVSLSDLNGRITPSGYLLVTETSSDDVSAALHLTGLSSLPDENLEALAAPVVTLPWCATVAQALESMSSMELDVAVIVNEYGDTIGILTREDILDTIFNFSPSRSKMLMNEKPIHDIADGVWIVAGVTSLRRLSKYLDMPLPASRCVTVAGVVQERLQKLASEGDRCHWGQFELQVIETPQRGHMLIRVTLDRGRSQ